MKKILLLIVLSFLATFSFAQKEKTTGTSYSESSARNIEPRQGMIVIPLIAELKVISEDRIQPYEEVFPYDVTPDIVYIVPGLKRTAFLNAAKKNNADAIVGSTIDVSTTPQGKLKIIITGYPAKYTNFRNATKDDIWLTNIYSIIDNSHSNDIFMRPEQLNINVEKEKSTTKP